MFLITSKSCLFVITEETDLYNHCKKYPFKGKDLLDQSYILIQTEFSLKTM